MHWLPIEKRLSFKLATLSYIIKSTGQPVYLRELLSDYQPVRTLRSSSKHLWTVNIAETVLATRGFRHSAVAVWNSPPDSIRDSSNIDIFKRKFETLIECCIRRLVFTNSIYAIHGTLNTLLIYLLESSNSGMGE